MSELSVKMLMSQGTDFATLEYVKVSSPYLFRLIMFCRRVSFTVR